MIYYIIFKDSELNCASMIPIIVVCMTTILVLLTVVYKSSEGECALWHGVHLIEVEVTTKYTHTVK
jgi:hypothetical protein